MHDEIPEGNDQTLEKQEGDGGGKWVHHLTNKTLGGPDGFLEFTVIGYDSVVIGASLLKQCDNQVDGRE